MRNKAAVQKCAATVLFIGLFASPTHAETYGAIFSRCVVDTMRNNSVTEEKAWKDCETIAQNKRDSELAWKNPTDTSAQRRLGENFWGDGEAKTDGNIKSIDSTPLKSTNNQDGRTNLPTGRDDRGLPDNNGYGSAIEKGIASAVGAAILASLILLIRSKPWTWRINMQRLTFARLVSRADTKQKRLCLVATPVAFSIALWLLIRDTHWFYYFDEIKFITVLFVTLSITLPVVSLSRLLDWVEGTK